MGVTVRRADLATIFGLRHAVLRSGLPEATARYDRDSADDAAHFGAFDGDALLGCVTIYREPLDREAAWRLRGMAVADWAEGRRVGRALLGEVDRHVIAAVGSPRLVWCNARLPAVGFYERCGWATAGGVFEISGVGPHRVMVRRVTVGRP